MSEQLSQLSQQAATTVQERSAPQGYLSWLEYWKSQGMPWRTEPEIGEERQRHLSERRAIQPDIERSVYPFKDIKLDRADVEWLLATHESRGRVGPVWWEEEKDKPEDERRVGLDLRGALPLARIRGGLALSELTINFSARPELELPPLYLGTEGALGAGVHLEEAYLNEAHLEHAQLTGAQLAGAWLRAAHLEGAQLLAANLEDCGMSLVHLEGAVLYWANLRAPRFNMAVDAHFEHADLRYADLGNRVLVEAHFEDADLRGVRFTDDTNLNGAWLVLHSSKLV